MMFLDKNKYCFDSFNHEFIHYYQWLTGDAIQTIKLDFNDLCYPKELELFFIDKNKIPLMLKNIINFKEFETYGNIFINQIKQYLPNNNIKIIREFLNEYNKNEKETSSDYLIRMYNSNLLQYLDNNNLNRTPFILFILNQIYELHPLYFQQHLSSAVLFKFILKNTLKNEN